MDVYHLGGVHGLYSLYERATEKYRVRAWKAIKLDGTRIQWFIQWSITMGVVLFSWIFFRAGDIYDAQYIIQTVLNLNIIYQLPEIITAIARTSIGIPNAISIPLLIIVLETVDHYKSEKSFVINQTTMILINLIIIILFGRVFTNGAQEFIYFQF